MLWLVASVCMEPQQCWHLLALVAYSLKPVKLLGPCKRTQYCWPKTPDNVGSRWYLLGPFAWAFKARLHYTRFLVRHGYKWYGCQKVEFSSFIYTSIFSRANNFIFAFGTRTKLKCSFRIRSAESLLPSTHASSVVSKWRMESSWKTFSSISLKGGDSRTEN